MTLKPSCLRRITNNECFAKQLRMCRSQRNNGTWHESKKKRQREIVSYSNHVLFSVADVENHFVFLRLTINSAHLDVELSYGNLKVFMESMSIHCITCYLNMPFMMVFHLNTFESSYPLFRDIILRGVDV